MVANDPSPDDGAWDTLRLINFSQGLARLTIAVRSGAGVTRSKGSILLQSFTLADGTHCMKANLAWHGTEHTAVYAIYSKPGMNWNLEASQIANKWLDGRFAETENVEATLGSVDAPAPLMQAAG